MGPAILEPFVSQVLLKKKLKNATFVWFSDYYVKIPLWGHSFLISLH
jgi:hypothetical protein